MFVSGPVPKGASHVSGLRQPSDIPHVQVPPSLLKGQAPHMLPVDRTRNPLLREVDDELRKLKNQFDMIRGDNYQPKVPTTAETTDAYKYSSTSTGTLKGVVSNQHLHSFKPATSIQQSNLGQISHSNQTNSDAKTVGPGPKKITQSFEMKKDGPNLSSSDPFRHPNNPEQQQYKSNVTSSERIPTYKNYGMPLEQSGELKPQPAQSAFSGQSTKQPVQKAPVTSQIKTQYGASAAISNLNKETEPKDTKTSNMTSPPPAKAYQPNQPTQSALKNMVSNETTKSEQPKFSFNPVIEHTESPKQEHLRTEPHKRSAGDMFKDYGIIQPKTPQESNSNTDRSDKIDAVVNPRPTQEDQQKPKPPQQRQNFHRPAMETPATQPIKQEPKPVPTPAVQQAEAASLVGSSGASTPSNDIQRYDAFQSERVRFKDPNPYVSAEAKLAAENKDKARELSPSQRERDASIKKYEAKKLGDLEERIGVLTKSNEMSNKENAQLKHQITRLTEELKLLDKMKADFQQMQATIKQSNERSQQLSLQLEEAQFTIVKRDQQLKDLEKELRHMKETIESDKSEGGFNMALKAQIEENQRIKERFAEKDEEIEQLRETNKTLRTQLDTFRNEVEIERLKRMTELKNAETTNDIEVQRLTNEVSSLQRVAATLDEKFKYMMKEDRKKDEFLVNYLKGKTHDPNDKELIVNFFKQFEEVPKLTVSELLRQEYRIQEDLKKEIQELKAQIMTGYAGRGSPTRPAY